jgi:hypothetical protein
MRRAAFFAAIPLLVAACGSASPPPAAAAKAPAVAKTPADAARTPVDAARAPSPPAAPTSSRSAAPAVPADDAKPTSDIHDLVPGGECPDPGAAGEAAVAAAGKALIPLKAGLTLSSIWKGYAEDYEHECLLQISGIDARAISATLSCPVGAEHETLTTIRLICWADVIDSYLYITGGAPKYPQTLLGALQFNLSVASFATLKTKRELRHRYIGFDHDDPRFVRADVEGTLVSDGSGTFKLIVNDKVVEVPTIEANYVNHKTNDIIRVKVLDEARFPLVLDYYIPSLHSFFVTYTKVSFPTANELEQHLAVDKHTDVYGIYFNFGSDSLRPESEPVLREISDALKAHPEWKLIINGHTDNIGGDALNLDLSRRRAAAVRRALVEQYKIEDSRLSTNGFGASKPKESNDSDRGRALNRRVELVRQ